MARDCFIIQPFDNGEYDKRYREIYIDTIRSSGFEPYRVDEDSGASIPISEIEKKIAQADVCFADISTDNPNVWCEVGLSIAHQRDLCLVCIKDRKLPFDVQHRQVIFYKTSAPSDFTDLTQAIEKRLAALSKKQDELAVIPAAIAKAEINTSDLNNFEVAVIGVLASELSAEGEHISIGYLRSAVDKQGYTSIAANAGTRLLIKKKLAAFDVQLDRDGDPFTAIYLTEIGWDWIHKNIDRFELRKNTTFGRLKVIDDDIPF